jgi:ribosomal-protein-alanine N-acetyltransferase
MIVLETERLILRHATLDDAEFILRLLNEPSFLKNIGDRGVRTVGDAQTYIAQRFIGSYERHGFGMWVVRHRDSPEAIGISGLVKRETLPEPDIGFAFLPEYWRTGVGFESAEGVKRYALDVLGRSKLLGIVNPENAGSIRILEKLGFRLEQLIELAPGAPAVRLYAFDDARPDTKR